MGPEFALVALPGLAVEAVERLRGTDPELFGAVLVQDGGDGVLYDQVPGNLDFYDVRFVIGVLDVVELLYLAGEFVEPAFGTCEYADGVLYLRVTL